ncbi:hypothetical protein HYU13_02230 [Candidatus Woesearchaeota archaeon]|nr:hypothetical protein [Candidatus Woesearchaeota archaeon]
MGAFANSFRLVKESFEVLKKDKEMLWFPILSGIAAVLAFFTFFIPFVLRILFESLTSVNIAPHVRSFSGLEYFFIFLYYLGNYFIIIFFNTGLITCAHMRLNGKDPKFSDGFKNALRNIGKVFIWAVIAATVGMVLRALEGRLKKIGSILVALLGMAWTLLTFFVIPVMVFENISVFESIKKSGKLFRKTWGENVIGQFSMGLFFGLLFVMGLLVLVFSFLSGSGTVVGLTFGAVVIFWVLLGIISSTLNGIFIAALYQYANTGKVPEAFSQELVKGSFRPKIKPGII